MPATCTHLGTIDLDASARARRPAASSASRSARAGCTCASACSAATSLCCDDSPMRHATEHNAATGHPIIRSLEPGELWYWCYADQLAFEI